jgi:MFS family permease
LKSSSISYGWIVVAGLSITETVSWGIIYYGFPVMLRPMEQELGWSRTALTGAFSVGLGASALAALPVGRWLDRHGPRALMTLGSCLGVALLLVWAHVHTLPALYLCWFGLGLAMAATLYEPAFAAVVSWFHSRHRDRALLTVTLTAGLASTIFMPVTSWLLGRMDWRSTLLVLAVVLAVLTIPIHAFVLRQAPRASAHGGTAHAAASLAPGVTAVFVIGNFSTIAVTVHLIPYLADRGYSPTVAALMIGWMGAVQLGGRLLFAPIATRFGYRWVTAVIFLVQGLALAQLALVSHLPTLVPFVVMLGAANGMATLARATTVAEIFGARHYGSISGAMAFGRWAPRCSSKRSAATRRCSGR